MFNKAIHSTTVTSVVADRLFSNITDSYAIDKTFLATLRALLRNRLPHNEKARVVCWAVNCSESEISNMTASQCMSLFIPPVLQQQAATAHNIFIVRASNTNVGEKMLDIVKANAGTGRRYMSNYMCRDDLRVFFARKVNALFYTDAGERNTVIFAANLELKHFHALQMMIPKYLPRLFSNSPLSEAEMALLKSLGNKFAVEYETLIEEFAKGLDIRSEIIRTKLSGFERDFERIKVNELKNEISTCQQEYDYHLSMLRETSQKMQERQYTLSGLVGSLKNQDGDSELMEYFMCNKLISIISVYGTTIEFVAHGYADIYDEEAFLKYVGNHNGFLYNELSADITKAQMEKLYRAIFSEGRYKLRVCAAYTVDMQRGINAQRHYALPSESNNYLPNPHIQHFACIGSYASRFIEYMGKQDYVGAIDQAVVSARNLNFYDSTVMSTFARELSITKKKCLEKPDGTLFTPLEAIEELEVIEDLDTIENQEVGTVCQNQ